MTKSWDTGVIDISGARRCNYFHILHEVFILFYFILNLLVLWRDSRGNSFENDEMQKRWEKSRVFQC